MSVTKTYSITIEYSKDDAGQEHEVPARTRGAEATSYTVPEMDDDDLAYSELRRVVLAKLNAVVPVSRGVDSARIVGTITES